MPHTIELDAISTTEPAAQPVTAPYGSRLIIPASTAHTEPLRHESRFAKIGTLSVLSAAALAACGGGGGSVVPASGSMPTGTNGVPSNVPVPDLVTADAAQLPGSGGSAPAAPAVVDRPSAADAARFLTQATSVSRPPNKSASFRPKACQCGYGSSSTLAPLCTRVT